ncbi:MAG: D-alanyl-D-alanine carboxypeptidase [Agathobacter sp.]|nr:D-alanyl-D-alanine carboxypeptidase [Agathobacter sp.]
MNIRKFKWKRLVSATLAAICFLSTPFSAKADVYWPEGPSINTPCAVLIEVNSGAVLYEKNGDEVNYPASITKVMTTMLALEHCKLDEVVTFSDDAINLNQGDTSHIARDYGEQMTMEQCLYAVMLESANECSYAVAEHVGQKLGGDYQTFIDLMNEKAKDLGCTNTHFNNSNGLPDPNHWTSAHDMALIAAEAYKNETFQVIVGCRSYRIPPTNKHDDITPLNNHHAMISNYKTNKYLYEYCTGGKTGFTQAAGSTLVTFAEKDGLTLVCVVMRTNGTDQYLDTTSLFEYGFQNFQSFSLAEYVGADQEENEDSGIMNNHESFVDLNEEAYVVLPVTANFNDVEFFLENSNLPGNIIAQLRYSYGDHMVGKVDVVPSKAVVEDNYFKMENQNSEVNIVEVKLSTIIWIVVGLILLIVGIILGKKLYDNYYLILHNWNVKKERRSRFRPINKKKKRWRKRDRMFK